jgi:hypothetical protein
MIRDLYPQFNYKKEENFKEDLVSLLIDSQYKKFILFQPYKKIKRYKTYFR